MATFRTNVGKIGLLFFATSGHTECKPQPTYRYGSNYIELYVWQIAKICFQQKIIMQEALLGFLP